MTHRIAMISANRKENAVIPDMTLMENGYIAEHALTRRHQYIHRGRGAGKISLKGRRSSI
jgi:ribose transport system ATP-binding protein